MYMKICVVGDVLDVSRVPSFKMKFSEVTILQGVECSIFPIDFEWALQQCSATALPAIYCKLEIRSVEHGICPIAEFTSPCA